MPNCKSRDFHFFAIDVVITVLANSSVGDLACVYIVAPDNCNLNKKGELTLTLTGSADGTLYVPASRSSAVVHVIDNEGI